MRIESCPVEELRTVDVAVAAHHVLIHEEQSDRGRLPSHDGGEALLPLLRVVDQRIRSELAHRREHLLRGLKLARGGTAQVGTGHVGEEAETNLGILMGKTKGIQAICSKCGMKTIFSASSFEASSYLELHEIKHLLMESA